MKKFLLTAALLGLTGCPYRPPQSPVSSRPVSPSAASGPFVPAAPKSVTVKFSAGQKAGDGAQSTSFMEQGSVFVDKNILITAASGLDTGTDLFNPQIVAVIDGKPVPVVRVFQSRDHALASGDPGSGFLNGARSVDYALAVLPELPPGLQGAKPTYASNVRAGDSVTLGNLTATVSGLEDAVPAGPLGHGAGGAPLHDATVIVGGNCSPPPLGIGVLDKDSNLIGPVVAGDANGCRVLNLSQPDVALQLAQDLAFFNRTRTDDASFLGMLSLDTTGSPLSQGQIIDYLTRLKGGTSRSEIAAQIQSLPQAGDMAINGLYRRYLGRDADVGGLAFFRTIFSSQGLSPVEEDLLSAIPAGDEISFLISSNRYSRDQASVSDIANGVSFLTAHAEDRIAYAQSLFASAEARVAHIEREYIRLLRRPAGANEIAAWFPVLDAHGIYAVRTGIVRSAEYTLGVPPQPASASAGAVSPSPASATVGQSLTLTLPITNTGPIPAYLSATVTPSTPFTVISTGADHDCEGTPFFLAPGDSCNLSVSFNPQAPGPFVAALDLRDQSDTTVVPRVSLSATANPVPPSLGFRSDPGANGFAFPGATAVGSTSTSITGHFTLSGGDAVVTSGVALLTLKQNPQNANAQFRIVDTDCPRQGEVFHVGECKVTMVFSPQSAGSFSTSVGLSVSGAGIGAGIGTSVYGVAVPPPSPSPASAFLSFEDNYEINGGEGSFNFRAGDPITVMTYLQNVGTGRSQATAVTVVLTQPSSGFLANIATKSSTPIQALDPGVKIPLSIPATIPVIQPGTYNLVTRIVDVGGQNSATAVQSLTIKVN